MLKRGILTEIPHIKGRNFYPLLAKVGKGDFCISPRKGIFQRLHDCCFCGKRHPEVTIDTDLRETVVLHESLNENTLGTSTV